jgi:glucose dehydrogenase
MRQRRRKLLGVVGSVLYLTLYCLLAMAIGGQWVVGTSKFGEALYFVVAGLAWLPGAMLIIVWMSRPDTR